MAHTPEEIVAAIEYLETEGMTVEELRRLHHFSPPRETFAAARRYFGIQRELRDRNLAYVERLVFVAKERRKLRYCFAALIGGTLDRFPSARGYGTSSGIGGEASAS